MTFPLNSARHQWPAMFLVGMASMLLAAPAMAGKPSGDAQNVHNGFLDNLESYAAAVENTE